MVISRKKARLITGQDYVIFFNPKFCGLLEPVDVDEFFEDCLHREIRLNRNTADNTIILEFRYDDWNELYYGYSYKSEDIGRFLKFVDELKD